MACRLLVSIRQEKPDVLLGPDREWWQALFEEAVCGVEMAVAKLREFEEKNP